MHCVFFVIKVQSTLKPEPDVRRTKPKKPSYLNLRLTSDYSVAELEMECRRLGFVAATENEINAAIAAGIRRHINIDFYSDAARFWAALRRKRLDCHLNLFDLAISSGLKNILWWYVDVEPVHLNSHFAAFELDQAAESLINQQKDKEKN